MDALIPDSIKRKTTQCPHGFGCLTTRQCGDRALCEVDYAYGSHVLRLASNEQLPCPYRVAFGDSQLCTCPVRDYLHAKERSRIG